MAHQLSQYASMHDRQWSSSPAPSLPQQQHNNEIPRPMNLRILYTFDIRGESQCLAKLPHALPVRTVVMADGSQIGVTQLRTCLQAILNASPEIYSDETDYTVYAFDPSEQGTPRVGHGKLSRIIQSNESSDEDQTMVTGLVKNNLALLATSQQVQDNLEVRLALTPVQTRGHSDNGSRSPYLQERAPSPHPQQGWPNHTGALEKLHPEYLMMLNSRNQVQQDHAGDALQRFMTPSQNQSQIDHRNNHDPLSRPSTSNNNFVSFQNSQTSRPGSPALSVTSNVSNSNPRTLKRAVSNVSTTSRYQTPYTSDLSQQLTSVDAGYVSAEEQSGPKRARVTQVNDRPGKNPINKKGDLRVVASTAASVRMHQPTAVRPQGHPGSNLEEPPRAPTPVPQQSNFLQRRPSTLRSGLSAETSFTQSQNFRSPYSGSNLPSQPNSAATSPEFHQAVSPIELGSSPPIIPGHDDVPSSPALPPLPIHEDSTFMSGGLNDMSEMDNEDIQLPPHLGAMRPPQKPQQGTAQKPKALQARNANSFGPAQINHQKARSAIGLKRTPPPSSDLGSELPKKRGGSRRTTDEKRSPWNKEKRRLSMAAKLAESVANGEIPPYCYNCGVIETPTWRRAWTKKHSGVPPHVIVPKGGFEDGAIIGVETVKIVEETGEPIEFRIFKKNLKPEDIGFDAISLCNPCGLWLKNRGMHRPEKLWTKAEEAQEPRGEQVPERERRPRLARGDEEPRSDMTDLATDAVVRPSLGTSQLPTISETAIVKSIETPNQQTESGQENQSSNDTNHGTTAPRNSSGIRMENSDLTAIEAEIITPGNRVSPANTNENTDGTVRRSLFSSPRSHGPLGVDIQSKTPAEVDDGNVFNEDDGFQILGEATHKSEKSQTGRESTEKETGSCPLTPKHKALHLPPVTPIHNSTAKDSSFSRSPSNLFKTPSSASGPSPSGMRITTSDFFSSSAKNVLHGAPTNGTPSRVRVSSPAAATTSLSPRLQATLRSIYEPSQPDTTDFSHLYGSLGTIDENCCPGPLWNECCIRNVPELDINVFPDEDDYATDEHYWNRDDFFSSTGATGFTPVKPAAAAVSPAEDTQGS